MEIFKNFGDNGPGRDKIEIAMQNGRYRVFLFGDEVDLGPFIE